MKPSRLAAPLAVVIAVIWCITALVTLVTRDYLPLTIQTPVMLAAAGWAFGIKVVKNGKPNE